MYRNFILKTVIPTCKQVSTPSEKIYFNQTQLLLQMEKIPVKKCLKCAKQALEEYPESQHLWIQLLKVYDIAYTGKAQQFASYLPIIKKQN